MSNRANNLTKCYKLDGVSTQKSYIYTEQKMLSFLNSVFEKVDSLKDWTIHGAKNVSKQRTQIKPPKFLPAHYYYIGCGLSLLVLINPWPLYFSSLQDLLRIFLAPWSTRMFYALICHCYCLPQCRGSWQQTVVVFFFFKGTLLARAN